MTTAPRPPEQLTARLARAILAQMGENGKPPELGISHVNVGNESYLDIIRDEYVSQVICADDGSSFKLVQGTYGAGKTHFLYCVRDLAWRRGLLAGLITISPKETPLHRPLAVYRAVAQRLELPADGGDPVRGIDDLLRARAAEELETEGREQAHAWADTALATAPLARHSFRDAALAYLHAVIDGDRERAGLLAGWLRGEEVTPGAARKAGIYELPANDNGFALLRSLIQTVPRLGYQGTVLLLDEAERRLSVDGKPSKSTTETMDHLRELVDLCGRSELPRTLVLYAVTPAFTQNVLPLYPALQQRLGAPVQYLSASNPRAPLIDLEALDLNPRRLLTEMGSRLLRVARVAHDWQPDEAPLRKNLEQLATTVADEMLEVGHRRLFVKLWIRLLDDMRLGAVRTLDAAEIRALVSDQQVDLLEEEPSSPVATFFGVPLKRR